MDSARPHASRATNWIMPAALAQPMPRKVSMNGCMGGLSIIIGMMAGMVVFLILAIAAASSHKTSVLKRRGVEITGHVISRHIVKRKNNDKTYFVNYRFEPPELSRQVVKFEGDEVAVSISNYYSIKADELIGVIYDPANPSRSMLSSEFDAVKKHDVWPIVWIVCGVIGGVPLALGGLFAFHYRREMHVLQWGKAVPAMITNEYEFQTRYGRAAKVSYSFEDDNGFTRSGKKTLPIKDDPRPDFQEERARYLGNPTAVFDYHNSKRNTLFPGTLAQLN